MPAAMAGEKPPMFELRDLLGHVPGRFSDEAGFDEVEIINMSGGIVALHRGFKY